MLLPKMRVFAVTAAIAVAIAISSAVRSLSAAPIDYPTRPITLVVPYEAGGGNDVIARLVAAKMSAALGKPIVVENRGGAGSTIGTRYVAKAKPDGYTILIATSALAINPSLYPDAGYDPKKDFAPVGLIATSANLVLVRQSLPVHSMTELVAFAKREPGKLNFASTGTGTSTHLAAELFAAVPE
jgi:tripartite-type tricarboxylate transporter receptor subunit TctC